LSLWCFRCFSLRSLLGSRCLWFNHHNFRGWFRMSCLL
jgi:hypothetical protein